MRGDSGLGDAKQCIGVENEDDEELTGGEFRIVEGRASRIRCFPVTATTPDTAGSVEYVEAVSTAVRTGSCFPDSLETPLDDGVERLGPKFYYAQFRKFRWPLAEGKTVFMHTRFCPARGTNASGSASLPKNEPSCGVATGTNIVIIIREETVGSLHGTGYQ